MVQTFDIRFARSDGLAALLEAPENSFRWKGGGLLCIDSEGFSIAVKRGLLSLFAIRRTRRFAAQDLTEVYREGEALRLEFNTPDSRRAVIPLWARDRAVAAEIVRLLPTRRTVEIDEVVGKDGRAFRVDVRLISWVAIFFVVIVLGGFVVARLLAPDTAGPLAIPAQPAPDATAISAPAAAPKANSEEPAAVASAQDLAPEIPLSPSSEQPYIPPTEEHVTGSLADSQPQPLPITPRDPLPQVMVLRAPIRDGVVPIMPGEPAYETARAVLAWFETQNNALRSDYLNGQVSNAELESRWWALTERICNSTEFNVMALSPLVDAELAASRNWRNALTMYSDAQRSGDRDQIAAARAELDAAGELTDRVKLYVY